MKACWFVVQVRPARARATRVSSAGVAWVRVLHAVSESTWFTCVYDAVSGTEVNGTTPQRLVSVGLPTLALTCISTDTVLTYP